MNDFDVVKGKFHDAVDEGDEAGTFRLRLLGGCRAPGSKLLVLGLQLLDNCLLLAVSCHESVSFLLKLLIYGHILAPGSQTFCRLIASKEVILNLGEGIVANLFEVALKLIALFFQITDVVIFHTNFGLEVGDLSLHLQYLLLAVI